MFQKILLNAFMFIIVLSQISHGMEEQSLSLTEKFKKIVHSTLPCTINNEEDLKPIKTTFETFGFTKEAAHQCRLGDTASQKLQDTITAGLLSFEKIKEIQGKLKSEGNGQNELNLLLGCNERSVSPISHPILIEIAADSLIGNSGILNESGEYLSKIAKNLLTTKESFTKSLLTGSQKSMINIILGMCQLYGEGNYGSYAIPLTPQSTTSSTASTTSTMDITLFECSEPHGTFRANPYNLLYLILETADQSQENGAIPSPTPSLVNRPSSVSPITSSEEDNSIFTQNCKDLHRALDGLLEAITLTSLTESLATLSPEVLGKLSQLDSTNLKTVVSNAHLASSNIISSGNSETKI